VRLVLQVMPARVGVGLTVDPVSGTVGVSFACASQTVSASLAPIARFHRGGAPTPGASATSGVHARGTAPVHSENEFSQNRAGPSAATGGSCPVRLQLSLAAVQLHITAVPAAGRVALSLVSLPVPRVHAALLVDRRPDVAATGNAALASLSELTDNAMGLRYAKGPDGTRGFHTQGRSFVRPRTGLLPPAPLATNVAETGGFVS